MTYLLGVDVGTTRTAAAVSRADRPGSPEMVSLGDRSTDVPSVLFLGPDGEVLVGEAAERRAVTNPDRVVREFKRRVGDPTPIVVGGRAWAAEELCARLLRWVVDKVAMQEGGPADRIAVTHPASWGTHKRDLMAAAAHAQGLTVTFLAEPQAAALHYAAGERVPTGSTIAVYDLGGGTFDAAVVRKDGGFGLLGRPEGLEHLGGVDFDQVVFDHVAEGAPEAFDGIDETDPAVLAAVARLRRECTEAKEALSADTEVTIPVLMPAHRGSVRLHRSEFEEAIRPSIGETVDALRRAVESAGTEPERLSAVLLVGGSSRIPLVAQLVSEQLGRPVAVDTDPKNAIAKGAVLAFLPQALLGATGAHPAVGGALAAGGAYTGVQGVVGADGGPPTQLAATGAWAPPGATEQWAPGATGQWAPGATEMWGGQPGHPGQGGPLPGGGAYADPTYDPYSGDNSEAVTEALPTSAGATRLDGPPARPAVGGGLFDSYAEYDDTSSSKARSPFIMIGAGGLVAAVALVAGVALWPDSSPVSNANTRIDSSAIAPVPTPEPASPAPTTTLPPPPEEPAPAAEPGNNKPAGPRPQAPVQNPPPVLPPPPTLQPTTEAPPPPTTKPSPPPTTTPSPPPTTTTQPPAPTTTTTPP
ncbi:Hsp70 family protein [Pseudonocardia lutea]|uniref:Hsp70 family protein n=1 Tax=Pseudonocardia lutea TaxID=2172015 RepID=A0ABW1I5X5_9PSEU